MENSNRNNGKTGTMLGSLLVGTVIGAAVGILMAPMSGEETRRMIKDRVTSIQTKGQKVLKETPEKVLDLVSDVSEDVQDRATKLKKIGRKVVKEQKASLKHGVEEAKDVLQT